MKNRVIYQSFIFILFIYLLGFQQSCKQPEAPAAAATPEKKELSHAELVARGRYLIAGTGCSDCHSTKKFGPQGPSPDSAFLLAGHIAGSPLPPIYKNALKPGDWVLLSGDFTAFVGPWGMSFAANLTPDSATGIGAWTDEVFIKTLRTGKHLGQDGGRAILPPMPWPNFALFSDEDLKSMFAYLQTIPAIKNKVPAPVAPPDVEKMK